MSVAPHSIGISFIWSELGAAGWSVSSVILGIVCWAALDSWRRRSAAKKAASSGHHSRLGIYRVSGEEWTAQVECRSLGYSIVLSGKGTEPCDDQVKLWEELDRRLPAILAGNPVGPPPEKDPWGVATPQLDAADSKISCIYIRENQQVTVLFSRAFENECLAVPVIEVEPNWQVSYSGWTI